MYRQKFEAGETVSEKKGEKFGQTILIDVILKGK